MKIIIKELKDNLIYIYFLSILFEAICLFKVSTFDVTVPFVVSLLLMLVSVLDLVLSNYKIGKRNFFIFCLFVLVIVLNLSFAKGGETNYNSLFLHCYYIVFFFLTGHGFHKEKFDKALDRYITLVFVFSIYAIYQFVAYNFLPQLPLKELIPSALLTRNYNTIARTHFFGQVMYRGHSIFLEPSYLSQFTAVSILLLLNQARCGIWRKNFWLIMIVNALAFATALAGTGVIILFAGMVYFLFISKMKKSMKILLFSAVGIGALLILPTEIGSYFLSRSGEISFAKSNTSGYYRFVIPFLVAGDIITKNFFGYGMGNDELAILPY